MYVQRIHQKNNPHPKKREQVFEKSVPIALNFLPFNVKIVSKGNYECLCINNLIFQGKG